MVTNQDRIMNMIIIFTAVAGTMTTAVAKSFENDMYINFYKVFYLYKLLSFYVGNLHILQIVMERDQMNIN